MELDKERLLQNIKEALSDNAVNSAINTGDKQKILNSLPTETKKDLNELLSDSEKMKQLLNSKEAKDIISRFLKDK